MPVTFSACNPLGPFFTSNSTAWPSFNDLYPSIVIAEKCTKTSSPVWRWIKPKPFDALNHFTVPCSFTLQPRVELLCRLALFPEDLSVLSARRSTTRSCRFRHCLLPGKARSEPEIPSSLHQQKVIQEQQTL